MYKKKENFKFTDIYTQHEIAYLLIFLVPVIYIRIITLARFCFNQTEMC